MLITIQFPLGNNVLIKTLFVCFLLNVLLFQNCVKRTIWLDVIDANAFIQSKFFVE